ncbi:MAG: lipopolysaccharide assembly protein LapB [Colwellia sp.]|jgi:lipopolysaccharide biosynthesis regulator YciM|uniref:lipopolysaccharide assembly protein LapB n=1 Tax=Colwellia sp. Bg11-12 TaxID=2759817 RepID=UPI0015F72605|nr:lipopolysaccharide assembly protein LapB [Colwellia sp. Bg11-12]MBA6265789.1 lipopolysaccharide assembly protein LapB [Colwellia sp. Bg11-12]
MLELLFLLLPVAMGYGWFMGRNSVKQNDHSAKQALSIKYSTGLNYLLSNQQDKAIDYLLEALKVEDDTVEAHFAMANLFRRRGELDRALKVHEHLVRQKHLPAKDKQQAAYELGKDFFSAGLYDRAETMFEKLLKSKHYGLKSLDYLMRIYQSTKDWTKGISHKKAIVKTKDKKLLHNLANFYCELATIALEEDNFIEVIELLELALAYDANSCRANWLLARIYEKHQQYNEACRCYQDIYLQDKEFFPDVINEMQHCYHQLDADDEYFKFIRKVYDETGGSSALIKYLSHIEAKYGNEKAKEFILLALKKRPTIKGFKHFIKMQMVNSTEKDNTENLDMIKELIAAYLNLKPRYSCRTCGFNSSKHYWACPSCHDWEQLKPVRGLEGE